MRAARLSAEKFPSDICRNGTQFTGLACRSVFLSFQHFTCSRPAEDFFLSISFILFLPIWFFSFFLCLLFLFGFFVLREHGNGTKKKKEEKLNARKFLVVCFVLIIETHRISLNVHKYKKKILYVRFSVCSRHANHNNVASAQQIPYSISTPVIRLRRAL